MTTSKEVRPTALELFNKFQPRFGEVTLLPVGWGNDNSHDDGEQNHQRMYCHLVRDGKPLRGYKWYGHPWIDIKESGIRVDFSYDPTSADTIHLQLFRNVIRVLESTILKNRTLRLTPEKPFTDIVGSHQERNFKLTVNGGPIPGFHEAIKQFGDGMNAHWTTFVPPDSSEGQAICAAIEYERAEHLEPIDPQKLRSNAGDTLDQLLARVA